MPDQPPLVVDIDGTITDADSAVDPRAFGALAAWSAPVVVATGKAFPYPVALCHFLGLPLRVVAENGGVVYVADTDELHLAGDGAAARAVAEAYREQDGSLGWSDADLVNRWRETEVAVSRDKPLAPLEDLADEHGLSVIDTGFAYHVLDPSVDKGQGLERVAAELGCDAADFLAVGDSVNDAPTFRVAGEAVAVANADDDALAAADRVTEASNADGFLEAIEPYR